MFTPKKTQEGPTTAQASLRTAKPSPFFQAKLTVNAPGDAHEQEADAVADQVMRMRERDAPIVQRMPLTPVNGLMRKCAGCEEKEKEGVQRKETGGGDSSGKAAPSVVSDVLSSGGGQPMESGTRQFMESRFGQDFSHVRIHTDSRAAESASVIQARAYTSGRDVVFGNGEYQPGSEGGRRLLAHELVHVGQQNPLVEQNVQREPEKIQRTQKRLRCNRLSKANTNYPNVFIEKITVDLGNLSDGLTIQWNKDLSPQSFKHSPGAGICCVDCDDIPTSQTSGYCCTPKVNDVPVNSNTDCNLGGHPTAKNPTRFSRRGIAIHSGNLPNYPASHGCVRTSVAASELIQDNSIVNVTTVTVSGNWQGSVCYKTENAKSPVNRNSQCAKKGTPAK